MSTVAALFVETGGCYFGLDDVDPWDEERDARGYLGPYPVVAHPPCQRWSTLAHIHKDKTGKEIGMDGGCFLAALSSVRAYGGVLEHPANSMAWDRYGLARPPRYGGWRMAHTGEWTCEVYQSAYGHRAPKRTWLYCVSKTKPPELNWGQGTSTGTVQDTLGRKARIATPVAFRDILISIAKGAV